MTGGSGSAEFFDTDDVASNANSLVATGRHLEKFRVKTVSVDEFVAARKLAIGCITVDVEGAELEALRGARATLGRDRPALALHPEAICAGGASLFDVQCAPKNG